MKRKNKQNLDQTRIVCLLGPRDTSLLEQNNLINNNNSTKNRRRRRWWKKANPFHSGSKKIDIYSFESFKKKIPKIISAQYILSNNNNKFFCRSKIADTKGSNINKTSQSTRNANREVRNNREPEASEISIINCAII